MWHTLCWRDSRLCIFGFQFGLYHVVITLSFFHLFEVSALQLFPLYFCNPCRRFLWAIDERALYGLAWKRGWSSKLFCATTKLAETLQFSSILWWNLPSLCYFEMNDHSLHWCCWPLDPIYEIEAGSITCFWIHGFFSLKKSCPLSVKCHDQSKYIPSYVILHVAQTFFKKECFPSRTSTSSSNTPLQVPLGNYMARGREGLWLQEPQEIQPQFPVTPPKYVLVTIFYRTSQTIGNAFRLFQNTNK